MTQPFDNYSTRGFHLFAMHGIVDGKCTCGKIHEREKDIGKHPATQHGYQNAVPADEYQHSAKNNVAVSLGKLSGCFVIDVDGEAGLQSLAALPTFPQTFTVKTGNGHHYYFQYPEFNLSSNQNVLGQNIEVKSNGASAHIPPSKHITGRDYKIINDAPIAKAPQWVFDTIRTFYADKEREREERQKQYGISSHDQEKWSEADVVDMLDEIDPNLSYHDWVGIGMALHDGGYSILVWDKWSSKGSSYKKGCCLPHWRSFDRSSGITMGTLVERAYLGGWRPKQEARAKMDTSKVQKFLDNAGKPKAPAILEAILHDDIPFDLPPLKVATPTAITTTTARTRTGGTLGFDPLTLPGLIGDTVRWIEKSALFPQPELALLATLCFAGAVFGRRYASPLNTRTNIYMVGISGTGTGKDHARKSITTLAKQADLSQFIGANSIRSESGLAREMESNSSQLMMIDEFGLFLQAVGDARAAPHARQISDLLMKFYSTSNSDYNHGTYADKNMKPITITDPNLCIYGTTTEEQYALSLQKTAIQSGNINRYVVIRPEKMNPYPNLDKEIQVSDKSLVARWNEFKSTSIGEHVNSANIKPKVIFMQWGACELIADELLLKQCRMRDNEHYGALWVRLYENTIKIAMIFAIARDRINPRFLPEDFEIGEKIVSNAIRYMGSLASDHMFDSETEKNNLEILRYIREIGAVSKSELLRKMRKLKRREIDDILMHMVDSGVLETEKYVPEIGRPMVMFKLCGNGDGA